MKLRLTPHHMRLRLTPEEVRALEVGRSVLLRTRVAPTRVFCVELVTSAAAGVDGIAVRAKGEVLRVEVPAAWVVGWSEDGREGFEEELCVGEEVLVVCVQKDYRCTTPRDCAEEQATAAERFERPVS